MSTAPCIDPPLRYDIWNVPNVWPQSEHLQHMNPSIDPNMFKPTPATSYISSTFYLLFGGLEYYARGGWNDYIDTCTSLEVAKKIGEQKIKEEQIDWYHIVDTNEDKIVFEQGKPFNYLEHKTL
jgi:hypothetical protein